MSEPTDKNSTQNAGTEPAELVSNQPAGGDDANKPEGTKPPEGQSNKTNLEDELPDWARKELRKARDDAAKYRTQLREAEKRLADAKTAEEFRAVVEELKKRNEELERSVLRSDVARKYKLPDELAEVLKGNTREEMEEHAKKLQRFAMVDEPDPNELRGGLDPNDDDSWDPVKVARQVRASRY